MIAIFKKVFLRREPFPAHNNLSGVWTNKPYRGDKDLERVETEGVPHMFTNTIFNRSRVTTHEDKERFCTYIHDYQLNMFRLAKSIVHNDTDAEDVTGEAILKAYRNLSDLRSFASFKPWIMKIVVNEAYSLANRRKKVMYLEELEVPEESAESVMRESGELWAAVEKLEDEFRTITVLFYYEDMSIRDIGKTLGLPTGTVKSRLARARQKLKVLLVNEGGME
ncbi:Sigma-70 region 2 [Desulfitobacterium hafniense DP7]|uniref:Sigma-70 region 2 n=2 Tax=Desulfitobacterium hafniense TaxID=49338 RepID=G9XGK7_DESHA|nr:Sigma-70 region 2 [Desulfitobacterium hafniense DP7]